MSQFLKRGVASVALLLGVSQAHAQAPYEFIYTGSFSDGANAATHVLRAYVMGTESAGVVTVDDVSNLWFDGDELTVFESHSASNPSFKGSLALDASSLDLYATDDSGMPSVELLLSTSTQAMSLVTGGITYTASWPLSSGGWLMGLAPLSLNTSPPPTTNTSTVPEPPMVWLALAGLPLMAGWRRRKAATA